MSERVTFFIDGTNLYFGLIKDLQRLDLDFQKLVQKLLNGRTLSRVYYYAVAPNQEQAILETEVERYKRQLKFLDALRRLPSPTTAAPARPSRTPRCLPSHAPPGLAQEQSGC